MSYPFESINNASNSYFFATTLGSVYELKFKPSPYLLGNEAAKFANDIYEFIIEVVYNPLEKTPPLDKNVATTIAAIIKDFYYKKSETICIYICDSSDGKQELRRRKFDDWFYSQHGIGLVKVDEKIADSKGNEYPISMILLKTNPYFVEIVFAFSQIANSSNK
jgi:Family of unknown function (DUF6169)